MRQVYRIELSGSFHLRGVLRLPGSSGVEGRMVDISKNGTSLAFLPGSDPNLKIGTEIEMAFIGSNGVQVDTRASVRNRIVGDSVVRYGFEFKDPENLDKNIPILMRAVFNRRRSPRVLPTEAVEIELESPGIDTLTANLINLSVVGVAVEVPFVAFEKYHAGNEVTMKFNLPGVPHALRVSGLIRGVRLQGPSVHLGIEYASDLTRDYESQVAALENYVASREVASPYVPG